MSGVIYVENSKNTKLLGTKKVDSTYASIEGTCPSSCPFKDNGCYSQNSYVEMHVKKLDRQAKRLSKVALAQKEAEAIDASYHGKKVPDGRLMRLHVSGDSSTITGTKLINNAVKRWLKRGGKSVWTYTHAWKSVSRKHWSNVSVLASVSSVEEAEVARKHNYTPALVVSEFHSKKLFTLPGSDIRWIPCPAQVSDKGCSDCQACIKTDILYKKNYGIAFAAHGVKKETIKRKLNVIQ